MRGRGKARIKSYNLLHIICQLTKAYFQFQWEKVGAVWGGPQRGKVEGRDHHREAERVRRRSQKRRGARAHVRGAK